MVVGTYHMSNPGQDFANVVADDVLAPKRQTEIARLAELLAAFRPTVVALEFVPRLDSTMNARYRQYRSGGYTLARAEQEQVGIRVAAALGLPGVNWHRLSKGPRHQRGHDIRDGRRVPRVWNGDAE
jgi:hypothetical protein